MCAYFKRQSAQDKTPIFVEETDQSWYIKLATRLLSGKIRRKAKKLDIGYLFLFMKANGAQLGEITKLIENGMLKPVIEKVFPFGQINDAIAYAEK